LLTWVMPAGSIITSQPKFKLDNTEGLKY